MQNRTYGDLFKLIQSLAGVNSFTSQEQGDISRFINRRYFQAYNESPNWVRYINVSEEREVGDLVMKDMQSTLASDVLLEGAYYKFGTQTQKGAPDYASVSGITSNIYARVNGTLSNDLPTQCFIRMYSGDNWTWKLGNPTLVEQTDGSYYVNALSERAAETTSNQNNDEPWDVSTWDEIHDATTTAMKVVEGPIVPYVQTNKNDINEFIRIHKKKAFLKNSAVEYEYYVTFEGAHIINLLDTADKSIFVTYKKKFSTFTTSSDYATSTETVPEEFFAFIAHTAYADFLRMDGQHSKAMLEEETAKGALDMQLERNDIISNINNTTSRFSTYVNRQSR